MESNMNNIIEITNFNAPELDVYARLTEVQLLNKEFPEKGLFIAESPKVIERALDAGYEPVSCLMEKGRIDGENKHILERMKNVPVFCAEFDILTQLTGFKLTRGMLCAMKRKPLVKASMVCRASGWLKSCPMGQPKTGLSPEASLMTGRSLRVV